MAFINSIQYPQANLSPVMNQEEKIRRERIAERVLGIYSPSGEEGPLMEFLFRELSSRGLTPRIDPAGNLVCEIGAGPRSLLLCPHADTVPGELPVERRGSLLYGRGACDAKGALLSMLFAFEDLALVFEGDKNAATTRVIFAAVVEEEKESRGLGQLIKDRILADAAVFGEPCGLSKVTIGYRGHVPVTFEIRTPEAHASAPWTTTNAAEVAFQLYGGIRSRLGKENGLPKKVEAVSVAITEIESGTVHNVIPGRARMSLDIRLPIGVDTQSVIAEIGQVVSKIQGETAKCEIGTEFMACTEPYRARMDSRIVRALQRSLLRLGVERPAFVTKSGTGDMNTYATSFKVDAVTYGPGDTKLSHTSSEFVDLEEVFACSRVLVKTVDEFSRMEG